LITGKHENKWSGEMPFAKYNAGCGMMGKVEGMVRGACEQQIKMDVYVG